MEIISKRPKWVDILLIIMGAFLVAASVNIIYEPIGMVTGGVSGLAIVIKYYTGGIIPGGIPIWVSNTLFNIPLFIVSWFTFGKKYIGKTLFATACLSVALSIVPTFNMEHEDLLLAAVYGGVLGGAGLGLVFATSATTGGTDLLCALINKHVKHQSMGRTLMIIDGITVGLGAAVFGLRKAAYAVISVYITTMIMDSILEGLKFAKLAYIISDKYEEIADEILLDMDRGVTGISTTGMYMKKERKMLFCVVSQKEIIQIKGIVAKKDPKAFVIVSDVREVMGEGFIEYKQYKP